MAKGKTNAIRLVDQGKISFDLISYEVDESDLSALSAAEKTGLEADRIFKTLVLRKSAGGLFVCVIPGAAELDLKKAARVSGSKKVDLIPVREIQALTGYIRGGCSPVGMKKSYPTYLDETCTLYETIYVSAGIRGLQMEIRPEDLLSLVKGEVCDLV
ncbi:MAG: Cys-tRNA(Pro) deacylase [Spirochaetales bacterium]|nr:Cys-tRNA(Pro) deacylase [Spirochaetales bacterium]